MVMLIMLMLMLMLMVMLLSMLLPRLQTKTALSRVSRVAKKKVKGLAKKYDAFVTLSSSRSQGYWAQASRRWVQIYMKQ